MEDVHVLVVGAGLSGAVLSRILAEDGIHCSVFEQVGNVGGHCHTARDPSTGIMVHKFGPHTLHTDKPEIWSFLERFVEIYPYKHRKQAWAQGGLYPFPLNLEGLNKFFGEELTPETARAFLESEAEPVTHEPRNFEEAGIATIGRRLYKAFYAGYTQKQWGRRPDELPPFVFRRLPIHLDNAQNVFHHKNQGQPVGGYTHMIEKILDHPNIVIYLNRSFDGKYDREVYDHLFYTGPIDRYFDWRCGRLAYRTLDFEHEYHEGQFQDCGTVNYCDRETPYTRIAEHKHFWPWEQFDDTIVSYEFSRECGPADKPYYPVRLTGDNEQYQQYVELARGETNVSFIGRLGTYRYLDMDSAIDEAMQAAYQTLNAVRSRQSIPPFFVNPTTPNHQ